MSTEIAKIEESGKKGTTLNVTQFYGGDKYGVMLQLTQGFGGCPALKVSSKSEPGYILLTITDAYKLIQVLTKWIKDLSRCEAEKLKKKIKENRKLEGTIFEDAVKCEHFIKNLEILDIPLSLLGLIKMEETR